jgi:hypothetical protein
LAPVGALRPVLGMAAALQETSVNILGDVSDADAGTKAITATGFLPVQEASGGGTASSASNAAVFQAQRLDGGQTRFLPVDETIGLADGEFNSVAGALACFPPGPILLRAWANGVPSDAIVIPLGSDTLFKNGFGGTSPCPY